MQNHSYENVLCLQVNFHANQSHFHMEGFAQSRFETEARDNLEMAYLFHSE